MTNCGDGILLGTEACDDANVLAGDGCSAICIIEPGFSCTGMPSRCTRGDSGVHPDAAMLPVDAGGLDGGVAVPDAFTARDASIPFVAAGGACGCSATSRDARGSLLTLFAALGLAITKRRRLRV